MGKVPMEKTIDLKNTVYEIYQKTPEILDVLFELGFQDIIKPGMLNTAGRFMTIPKGAAMKKINLESIKVRLEEKGYKVIE